MEEWHPLGERSSRLHPLVVGGHYVGVVVSEAAVFLKLCFATRISDPDVVTLNVLR